MQARSVATLTARRPALACSTISLTAHNAL
jgi:hypothetical protein